MSSNELVEETTAQNPLVITHNYCMPPGQTDAKKPLKDISWQTMQKLDKNFKLWPGVVQAGNFVAKLGVIAFMPNEMRPTLNFIVDNATDAVYASPYKVNRLVENVFDELNIDMPHKKKRKRFKEASAQISAMCAPCVADSVAPQPTALKL